MVLKQENGSDTEPFYVWIAKPFARPLATGQVAENSRFFWLAALLSARTPAAGQCSAIPLAPCGNDDTNLLSAQEMDGIR